MVKVIVGSSCELWSAEALLGSIQFFVELNTSLYYLVFTMNVHPIFFNNRNETLSVAFVLLVSDYCCSS